jgi:hypothetical protein
MDDGGMSIRVDPRRLSLLKELAGAEGLRPGQLVQRWVEERLDAERSGEPTATVRGSSLEANIRALESQLATLVSRIGALEQQTSAARTIPAPVTVATVAEPVRRRRGRPPKDRSAETMATAPAATRRRGRRAAAAGGKRVPLHEEIIAIIGERGPMSAAELATTIKQRGRYAAPRSAKPLDAATVNSRVSNPVYRSRFTRASGKIGLAG